ncbi:MAG: protein kinase [Pirellulaceae bacterium]|nr:protein kinase [Pirellulaceae bacterium]
MPAEIKSHPSSAELHSFAHGRLAPAAMADVEQHVATCDSCCQVLESVPEDTLVQLAREAATETFRAGETPPSSEPRGGNAIPPELLEHSRYKILGLVGQGGMGAVYKAEHRLMERLVALKVISRSFTANPQAVERFRREVKAAAKLSHANIVTAHDAEQAGELHFLVMEFVEGVGLDRLVAKQGVPTVPQACGLIRQAALGLQHAHEKGMVHRDIKPANLMVTRRGQLKILDFGLARLARELVAVDAQAMTIDQGAAPSSATAAGMILGTPDYISPEQAADSRQADIRADIYSLGCTFYFLLTGQPPFPKGTVMQKLASHMHSAPPSVTLKRPEVPVEVAAIVERMMAKETTDRYQTPGDVAKDLAAALKGTSASLPKLEVLKPAEDLFAAIDLAAIPVPLTSFAPQPLVTPAGGDISDWFAENRQLATMIGAIGGGLLLVLFCFWGANKLFFQEPGKATAKSSLGNPEKAASVVAEAKPIETATSKFPASSPAAVPGISSARVLFCVPHLGLWEPDFLNVVASFPAGVAVTVASTKEGYCEVYLNVNSTETRTSTLVSADVVIGRDAISASDYDAIIFAGANSAEFPTPATKQLLADFHRDKKFITAICKGQEVLANHGYFEKGDMVARNRYLEKRYEDLQCSPENSPVVHAKNKKMITGRDPDAGAQFADALVKAIAQDKN